MAVQSINTTKLPNQLTVSPGTGKMLVIMGPASSGSYDTPIALARASDIQSMFGQGPLVEAACYAVGNYPGSPVICIRCNATTVSVASAITATRAAMSGSLSTSTSVVTVTGGSSPLGDYEFGMVVAKATSSAGVTLDQGTLGTDNVYVQWTTDNFRTMGPVTKLPGTLPYSLSVANSATTFDSGIALSCTTGTLSVGDSFYGISTAPVVTRADVATAITALKASSLSWEMVLLASALSDATPSTGVAADMDGLITDLMDRGLFKCWVGHAPLPTVTSQVPQTDADYQSSSAVTAFATYSSSTPALIGQSGCLIASKNPTWPAQYILPPAYAIAPWAKSLGEAVSIADSELGPLPGVSISDGNGNPLGRCHDEAISPGADDNRFCTLRTWPDVQGTYVNLPTLMAQSGSDFTILQRLRVWNLFAATVWTFFRAQLQKGVRYDEGTGHILKSEADRLEENCNRLLDSTLTGKNMCTDARVAVSRTDDLRVNNPTLTVEGGVQPLSYPTYINLRLGFLLPG